MLNRSLFIHSLVAIMKCQVQFIYLTPKMSENPTNNALIDGFIICSLSVHFLKLLKWSVN